MVQKFSVRRALERGFRKYLTKITDFVDLLMIELQKLLRDAHAYECIRHNTAMSTRYVLCFGWLIDCYVNNRGFCALQLRGAV